MIKFITDFNGAANCLRPEPYKSSAYFYPVLKAILILSFHLLLGQPSFSLSLEFSHHSLCEILLSVRVSCPAYPILPDLITRIIFGELCRLRSSSFCILHHFPATTSLSVPNTFPNTLFSKNLRSCPSHNMRSVFLVSRWISEIGTSRMGSRPAPFSTALCNKYLQNDIYTSHEINRLPLRHNSFNELKYPV